MTTHNVKQIHLQTEAELIERAQIALAILWAQGEVTQAQVSTYNRLLRNGSYGQYTAVTLLARAGLLTDEDGE